MFKIVFIIAYYLVKISESASSSYDYDYYNNNDFEGYVANLGSNWNELDKANEMKFEESISKCANQIIYNNSTHIKRNLKHYCFASDNLDLVEETLIYGSGKLFSYDQNIIGLITNGDFSIRFYNFNPALKSLTRIYMKSFNERVPFDACVDKEKNIYIVFPDEQMIAKYTLETSVNNGLKYFKLKETAMKVEREYNPSSISCYDDHIYLSERPSNIIRVYDHNLNLVKKIEINGVVISAHRAIDVNQVARIFADDSSGVAFFNQIENSDDNSANACHFYHQKNCVEDITLKVENKSRTLVYIANGCSNEVKQFEYTNNGNLNFVNSYNTNGKPVSVLATDHGYVFILTKIDKISKIKVYYPRMCDSHYRHKKMLI